jgi:cytochrome c
MRVRGAVLAVIVVGVGAAGAARAEGDAARGEKKFGDCASCHAVAPGAAGVGPNLHGMFERKAGTIGDFRYSPAMKKSGITWTAQTLDSFLADPQKSVPGNRMPYAGMTEAGDRADLIAYLMKATK